MARDINAKTRLCGLIGNPVEHSKSPLIHNNLSEKMDINMVYVTFKVEQGRLADAIKGAYALNVQGLNVTVPYKCDVIDCLYRPDNL